MTLQTTSVTIRLNALKFGHEANPPINARLSDRESDVAEFASSIKAHGLIHPLLVKEIEGQYYVADGNRRLASLRYLVGQGSTAEDAPIKCELDTSDSDAAELSLAANVMRRDLHEADKLVAFKELAKRGLGEGEIASRFGVTPARVRKFLAIGNIAPVILDAWRNDELGNMPVEMIRAFTIGQTAEEQERVFHKLKNANQLYANAVRHEFGADDHHAQKFLKICGVEAYLAAGGTLIEDLFGDNHAIQDPQLAQQCAHQALVARQTALLADGWAWASFPEDMPQSWNYAWEKLKPGKKGNFTPEQMAVSGCVIVVDHWGGVNVTEGLVKPVKPAKNTSASSDPAPATISAALMERLSVQATLAIRDAIELEPRIGFIALLAAHMTTDYSTKPVHASHEGMGKSRERSDTSFTAAFDQLWIKSDEGLIEVAAGIAAAALDLLCQNPTSMPFREGRAKLVNGLDKGNTYVALRQRFDADDYFKSAPKAFILKAIEEAINEDEARRVSAFKKPELAAFALANVPSTGWLPVELRTEHYSGPGAE